MFSEAGEAWVLAAMTQLGAEQITTVAAVIECSSTHVPEDGLVGDGCAIHTLMRAGEEGLCSVLVARNWVISSSTTHTRLRVRA